MGPAARVYVSLIIVSSPIERDERYHEKSDLDAKEYKTSADIAEMLASPDGAQRSGRVCRLLRSLRAFPSSRRQGYGER
jgi:hypothetical protein